MADCAVCTKPLPDTGYVCHLCTAALATTLLRVAELADDLHTTVARLDRIERPNHPHQSAPDSEPDRLIRFADRPGGNLLVRRPAAESAFAARALPVNLDAAGTRDAIATTLTLWASHIRDTRGVPHPTPPPHMVGPACPIGWCSHDTCRTVRTQPVDDELALLAKFVAAHLGWLRLRPEAGQAWADLSRCHDRAVRTVDRPAAQWYAGRCWEPLDDGGECAQDLYVAVGQDWIRCRTCKARHSVKARRQWLLEQAREHRAPAADVARFLSAYAEIISTDFHRMLRVWITRRLVMDRGTDRQGRPVYRVGDVLDRIEQATQRRQAGSAVA